MNVEIINPEVLTNLYKNHGLFACTCYDTPEQYADRVGRSCAADGHMSGSRCEYIKFRITGLDRGTAEQTLRHELGTVIPYEYQDNYTFADYSELIKDVSPDQIVKNMASFRYIDKEGFKWVTPKTISSCEDANKEYDELMHIINTKRVKIKNILINNGATSSAAVEAANFVLPRATTTSFVIGFTPEALIHYCHKRLCTRSQEFIQELARKIKAEVKKYSDEFAKELIPQCQHLLWCPEGKRCCGAAPTKQELKEKINNAK
jgi:thymidylate synthase ThyX